jgi:hypothetical protein
MTTRLVAAVYLVDRTYGGPEEGGWWYTGGDLVRTIRVFRAGQKQQAQAFCDQFQTHLDATLNRGRRPISSVLSTGRYYIELHDGNAPEHYPTVKPHYE